MREADNENEWAIELDTTGGKTFRVFYGDYNTCKDQIEAVMIIDPETDCKYIENLDWEVDDEG